MRLQSAAIVAVVGLVGVTFSVAGSPWWVAVLYLALAVALAVVRLRIDHPAPDARRAIGYTHTAGDRPRDRSADVRRFCEDRGLKLTAFVHDGGLQRPSLAWALAQLEADKADVLVVGRLQDLSPDVASLAPLLKWFDGGHRTLIAVDLALDTSTDAGRLAASAVADIGAWDARPAVSKPSLTLVADEPSSPAPDPQASASPAPTPAPASGPRPTAVADVPELQGRIRRMRAQGMTLQAIADVLNAEGVPTLRGGALWRPSSVQRATGYRRPARGIEVDL